MFSTYEGEFTGLIGPNTFVSLYWWINLHELFTCEVVDKDDLRSLKVSSPNYYTVIIIS